METLFAPLLSVADPELPSEGTLDPLGLYAVADRLATLLVPGVRQRMVCPRFLTLIAVGREVTRGFDPERVAKDGVSSPEMVYEWIVVEALVRTKALDRHHHGLPGSDKTSRILGRKGRLSARTYLKSPRVMGFHGYYRTLAKDLGVIDEEMGDLGELGHQLVVAWEKEQQLPGFRESGSQSDKAGAQLRRRLERAIERGLQEGGVEEKRGSWLWDSIRDHLAPGDLHEGEEARLIRERLLDPAVLFRGEVMQFLVSEAGQKVATAEEWISERRFHEALLGSAGVSDALRVLLTAIDAYEAFSRLIVDAFEDSLELMTRERGPVPYAKLGQIDSVRDAAARSSALYRRACDTLVEFKEGRPFQPAFEFLLEPAAPDVWVQRLLEHHVRNQRRKSKRGKMPWFWDHAEQGVEIRPAYRREGRAAHNDSYLHAYRTSPLWSFAGDLGLVSQ